MGATRVSYLNAKRSVPGREVAVIEVDPDRADHVRDAFDLNATEAYTLGTLTDILEEKGLRYRPTAKQPSRPMTRSTVHRMLCDDVYVGTVTSIELGRLTKILTFRRPARA